MLRLSLAGEDALATISLFRDKEQKQNKRLISFSMNLKRKVQNSIKTNPSRGDFSLAGFDDGDDDDVLFVS